VDWQEEVSFQPWHLVVRLTGFAVVESLAQRQFWLWAIGPIGALSQSPYLFVAAAGAKMRPFRGLCGHSQHLDWISGVL